jgi:negative regulator of flagellin synthesis FlgM
VKIDSAFQSVSSIQSKTVKSKASVGSGGASGDSVSDRVQLTGASSFMNELEAQLSSIPVEDAAKVESVRAAIADGSFRVDEEAVAEGMVQETIEQLSHQHTQ